MPWRTLWLKMGQLTLVMVSDGIWSDVPGSSVFVFSPSVVVLCCGFLFCLGALCLCFLSCFGVPCQTPATVALLCFCRWLLMLVGVVLLVFLCAAAGLE